MTQEGFKVRARPAIEGRTDLVYASRKAAGPGTLSLAGDRRTDRCRLLAPARRTRRGFQIRPRHPNVSSRPPLPLPTAAVTLATALFQDCRGSGYFDWTLAGDNFTIGLSARGFTQYLRRAPIHRHGQWLSVEERGGFSFDQQGYTR